jgi:hypothetical protein
MARRWPDSSRDTTALGQVGGEVRGRLRASVAARTAALVDLERGEVKPNVLPASAVGDPPGDAAVPSAVSASLPSSTGSRRRR